MTAFVQTPTFAFKVETWTEDAKCVRGRPEDWYVESLPRSGPNRAKAAKKLCAGCPVIGQCADYALRTESNSVVMAGIALRPNPDPAQAAELRSIYEKSKQPCRPIQRNLTTLHRNMTSRSNIK